MIGRMPMATSGTTHQRTPPLNQPDILAIDTRHGVGHTKLGTCPHDTCPHTCYSLNQNINGLGGRSDEKLEKLISMIIASKIHAYCIQETWQLHNYMLTIRGYTVFYHGMDEKPQRLGRTSAGVIIILGPDLTQAWTQAGKLEPITPSPIYRKSTCLPTLLRRRK